MDYELLFALIGIGLTLFVVVGLVSIVCLLIIDRWFL